MRGQIDIRRDRVIAGASGLIEDTIRTVSGVQLFRRSDTRTANPTAQGITERGLGGNATSRTRVLLDGVPLADPFFGAIPFSAINPAGLSHVRLVRGGGRVSAGAGSVAGTIDLFSAGPRELGDGQVSAFVNDRGEGSASAVLPAGLGSGFLVAQGAYSAGPGAWITPADQRQTASVRSRHGAWNAGLRLAAPLAGEVELQARLALFADRRTLRFAGATSTSSGQEASARLVGQGPLPFEVLGYVQLRDFSNVTISPVTFRPTLDQHATPSTGFGGRLELRPSLGGDVSLRLGADWHRASGEAREIALAASGAPTARRLSGGRNETSGVYVEAGWSTPSLTVSAGARADRWGLAQGRLEEADGEGNRLVAAPYPARRGWDGAGTVEAAWRAADRVTLRAAMYTGVRLPTLNELYRPFVVFPVRTQANPSLRNERLRGVEAGVQFAAGDRARFAVTAFHNRLAGAIANVTIAPTLRERRNLSAIRSQGIEAELHAGYRTLELDGSVAMVDARVEGGAVAPALNGKRPAQTANIAATLVLTWQPRPAWRFSATLRHVGHQFEDDLGTDRLPAATTLDVYARVPLSPRLAVVLRAENLTDTALVTRNQGGSVDLGTPRTVWLGALVSLP